MEYYAYLQMDILRLQGQEEHTGVSGPTQNPFKATGSSPSALLLRPLSPTHPTLGEHRVRSSVWTQEPASLAPDSVQIHHAGQHCADMAVLSHRPPLF